MPHAGQQSVTQQVICDLLAREQVGIQTYGDTLRTFNGRRALVDAYQEAIDLVQYLKQEIMEREILERKLQYALIALATIYDMYGQVCEEYVDCTHQSCAASYGAWATADEARRAIRHLDGERRSDGDPA